jgi:hypothetical protein
MIAVPCRGPLNMDTLKGERPKTAGRPITCGKDGHPKDLPMRYCDTSFVNDGALFLYTTFGSLLRVV